VIKYLQVGKNSIVYAIALNGLVSWSFAKSPVMISWARLYLWFHLIEVSSIPSLLVIDSIFSIFGVSDM